MNEKFIKKCIANIQLKTTTLKLITNLSSALSFNIKNITTSNIKILGELITCILKKYWKVKNSNTEYCEWLLNIQEEGTNVLKLIISKQNEELKDQRLAAFKELINLVPVYAYLDNKLSFPIRQYGDVAKIIIISDGEVAPLINILKEYMMFKDMFLSLWLAIQSATDLGRPLTSAEVKNTLLLLQLFDLSQRELKEQEESFCKISNCNFKLIKVKESTINICARTIWERLVQIELPPKTSKLLMLTVLEKLMPNMNKPIFLLDYFSKCFEQGGANSMLAINGLFELIYKNNLDYPDIFDKLYQMFNPKMFGTRYKSRFYILANTLLSSLYLPKALVASFIKRFARLCLVAPPCDIRILLNFILNLLIRHPELQKLIINESIEHMDNDPFLEDETNPSNTRALDSFLWELVLLQNHILPSVADAANFIKFHIPTIEKDFAPLLDITLEQMFQKKIKMQVAAPPLTFVLPTQKYLSQDYNKQGFSLWDFTT